MKTTFRLFHSDQKSFHWNLNNILFLLFLFFGFISILNIEHVSEIAQKGMAVVFLAVIIMSIANLYRKKPFNGTLEGMLTLDEQQISINGKIFAITEIKKIFLRMDDYDGHTHFPRRISLFPTISNGTNNLLDVELKNGGKIKAFFQIEYQSQVQEVQPFIISLLRHNLITTEKAIELLRLNNDYLLTNFTEKLNQKKA